MSPGQPVWLWIPPPTSASDGANVSLQPGAQVVHNQASVNGGGVFNDCAATLSVAPGATILFNSTNNVLTDPGCLF